MSPYYVLFNRDRYEVYDPDGNYISSFLTQKVAQEVADYYNERYN